jgi:hypothetical protein
VLFVTDDSSAPDPVLSPKIDTSVPHSARIFTYWLGGKDNFAVDRVAGDKFRETFPDIVNLALIGRQFLKRVIRYLAGEAGIRQFLDIGTGLPAADNTHEVAQRVAPASRVVYVDNDPLVLVHARALLIGTPEGSTDYLDADVHDPEKIIAAAADTLDFTRPVAVTLMGILAHVDDYDEARSIVSRLMSAVPSGGYLAVRDGTDTDPAYVEAIRGYNASGAVPYHLRSPDQIAGYFEGLELVEPGVMPCPLWRPDADSADAPRDASVLGGVGRKP